MSEADIERAIVREAWREYYHSVRVLRRIRQQDPARYRLMARAYWRGVLRYEDRLAYIYGYDKGSSA